MSHDDLPLFARGCSRLESEFLEFHRANPHVLDELIRLAREARAAGMKRIGIGMLYEVIRWKQVVETKGSDWRLNNSWRSRYVRLIEGRCPDLRGAFEKRRLRA